MRIGVVNNTNSFKGLIKFKNKIINPAQIVSIEQTGGKTAQCGKVYKEYYFTMSNGEKYAYHTYTKPNDWAQKFDTAVFQTMNSEEYIEINEELWAK